MRLQIEQRHKSLSTFGLQSTLFAMLLDLHPPGRLVLDSGVLLALRGFGLGKEVRKLFQAFGTPACILFGIASKVGGSRYRVSAWVQALRVVLKVFLLRLRDL